MTENTEGLIAKIETARDWARKHFNAAQAGDPRFVDDNLEIIVAYFVQFPDVDRMRVTPSTMGKPMGLWFEYRLAFRKDGSMAWIGKHPFWGTPMPPLEVR